jgi:phosphoglycolate phosphatase
MDIKRKFIGPPLKESFSKYCGFDEETTEKAIKLYRERYSKVGKYENRPYEGIPEMLKALKSDGRVLIIASSKPTEFVEDILKKFDIYEYFDIISGADMAGLKGEKEDVIDEALKRLNIDSDEKKKEVVMIGDRHYDIFGAKHFGLDSIGVNYGFAFDKNELKDAGATYVVETVSELKELLRR